MCKLSKSMQEFRYSSKDRVFSRETVKMLQWDSITGSNNQNFKVWTKNWQFLRKTNGNFWEPW